ncbi:MAG: hypothetical protein IPG86_12375 [Chitinophagaceae bacterium]|nr:hypothetical protein [Chitinophagaceae bacterium]
MKKVLALLTGVLILTCSQAQISVRVKKNGGGSEVDVKTTPRNTGTPSSKPSGNDNKTSPSGETKTTPPVTESPKPATDTAAKPAVTATYDASYTGPAKVSLKSFWTHMEKIKAGTGTASSLNNADRMLKQIKEQDPGFDISTLSAMLQPYKEKAAQEASSKADAKSAEEAKTLYFKNFHNKMIGVYSSGIDIQPGVVGAVYLERVKALNIEEYKEKRKEAPEGGPNSYPVLIDAMLADYENYVQRADRLKWNVIAPMTASRTASNPQEKTAILENARKECEAVLILSPNNTAFKQKLDEINKLMGAAGAEAAKFYTSDFHKENLNKIVWSTQPLVIGKEKEMAGSIKQQFKTGDYIFGTVYLGVLAKETMGSNTNLRIRIRVDGGTAVWGGDLSYIELPLAAQGKSWFQFALIPNAQWLKDHYAPYVAEENWTLAYFLNQLVSGGDISHNITCELMFPTNTIDDIKSSFSLDLGAGSAEIKTLAGKLNAELMASRTLPKAGMSNAALEQQMVAAANNLGWNDKFLKAIITSSSWTVHKNELTGAILYRWLGAVCTTKDNDGKCFYQEFSFKQEYTGGGNYSGTVKFNSYGGKREIGCDKLK